MRYVLSSTSRRAPDAELLVERLREGTEGAASLVAVESEVAARDVLLGDAALAGAGDAHDDDHLGGAGRGGVVASGTLCAPNAAESIARSASSSSSDAAACRGAARSPGGGHPESHDRRGELEEPGERDLGRSRAVRPRDLHEHLLPRERCPARRGPTERGVGEGCDPELGAALDDATAERAVVDRAQRDLDGRDRRKLERLVELRAVDVRDSDAAARGLRRASRASARTEVRHGVRGSGAWIR